MSINDLAANQPDIFTEYCIDNNLCQLAIIENGLLFFEPMPYRSLMRWGVLCVLLTQSCRKEYSKEDIDLPVVVTPTPLPQPEMCSYSPYSVGSSFNYQIVNVASQDTFLYTIDVRRDTILNGTRYAILSSGAAQQYINCNDGVYSLYEQAVILPNYKTAAGVRRFLFDYKEKDGTWSDTINIDNAGQQQTGLLQYTVVEKGTTKTVLGKVYTNVIGVRQDAALLINGKVHPINNIATYYYSPGVGYIETDNATDTIRIKSYTIGK